MLPQSKTTVPPLPAGCSLAFPTTGWVYVAPTGTPSGRRHYLFPGLGGDVTQWNSGEFLSFVQSFTAAGDDVVELNVPANPQTCYFTNGGWQYRAQLIAALNTIRAQVVAAHGTAREIIMGGVSYGGLHAMMAAASLGWAASWWALVPVTRLDQLTEFAGIGNVARFNPFYDVRPLSTKPGWIGWGTADTRTNWQMTAQLGGELGPSVTKMSYSGQDHTATAQNLTDLLAWLAPL